MAVTNPGSTVPLGTIRDSTGKIVPLYVGQEWLIFFQSLFARTGGASGSIIEVLEQADTEIRFQTNDQVYDRQGRVNRAAIVVNAANIATNTADIASHTRRLKEIEFLGAFSWA